MDVVLDLFGREPDANRLRRCRRGSIDGDVERMDTMPNEELDLFIRKAVAIRIYDDTESVIFSRDVRQVFLDVLENKNFAVTVGLEVGYAKFRRFVDELLDEVESHSRHRPIHVQAGTMDALGVTRGCDLEVDGLRSKWP